MKLTAALLLLAFLQVSAGARAQKVTLSVQKASLSAVFNEISRQTGLSVMFDEELIKQAKPVTISVKDATIEEALQACLKDQPFGYNLVNGAIVIRLKTSTTVLKSVDSLPLRKIKVNGTVYNESGEPLSGANITIKKSGHGTITDAKGEFILFGLSANSIITVSFVGYTTQQFSVKDSSRIQVYLKVAKNELDKVVIQGYGTTTERLNTGSIATVTAAEIERQPVMNPLTALQGQVPGLVVTQDNGYASAPFKVEIRGRSVLDPNIPSDPLYIVDGVPLTILETGNAGRYATGSVGITQNGFTGPAGGQSPFFSINPEDIESISVLKDADATAIYGSRGANGVIIITTKRGKPGKTKLDVSAYQGESFVTQRFSMMNTEQYLQMRREALKNDGITANVGDAYDLLTWDTTRYTNFQNAIWGGMGRTTDIQAGLSGGDQQTTFRISGTYHRQTSILTASGADQRASVQFNLTHKSLNQRLLLSFTNIYSYAQSNLVYLPGGVAIAPNSPAFFFAPGQLNWAGWGLEDANLASFAGNLLNTYLSKTGFLNSQLKFQYDILKGLHFSTELGYSTTHNSQLGTDPIAAQDPDLAPYGNAQFGNNNMSNAIVEPQLKYDGYLGKGKLEALAGGSYQSASVDGNNIFGNGYTNDNLLRSIANAATKNASDDYAQYRYAAAFGRINYNWANEFILNLSARRDGSSRFGPGKQFGNFAAVGGAWIFTEEGWFKRNLPALSFGKVRGSYGLTGSDGIGNYQYLSQWSAAGTYPYNGTPAFVPILLYNPDLQWQTNKKLEGALSLGFLKDNLTVEVAWYQNRSSNELVIYNLPYLTGFSSITANLPATIQNTGLETTIRAKIISKKDFTWSAKFDIGANRNKLVSYPGLAESSYAGAYTVGQPLNITKLLHYTGVDPLTGQYTFQDKNHNGTVDAIYINGQSNDLYDKDLSIKFDGGFGTDLQYKGLQLSLFFRFREEELPSSLSANPGTINSNQSTELLNHWQYPGDKAKFARYTTLPQASDEYFYAYSDGVYTNGSYIRLQNVSLTYDLPGALVKKAGLQNCRIYARGENLFLLTKYEGVDPDSPSFATLPPAKILTAGIQFIF